MSIELKIKIKSLAAEAQIIRREEAKVSGARKQSLQEHRKTIVRSEARHSLLAYGFLRGRPYQCMELKCHESPDWSKVLKMAERFGQGKYDNEFKAWRDGGNSIAA